MTDPEIIAKLFANRSAMPYATNLPDGGYEAVNQPATPHERDYYAEAMQELDDFLGTTPQADSMTR